MKGYRLLIQCYLTTTWPLRVLLPTSLQPIDSACQTRGQAWFEQCDALELILWWSWFSFGCFWGVFMRVVKRKGIPECVVLWFCYPFPKCVATHFPEMGSSSCAGNTKKRTIAPFVDERLWSNLHVQTPGISALKRMLLKHLRHNSWLHSFLIPRVHIYITSENPFREMGAFQNGSAWIRSDADAAHMRKASSVIQMRQTRQMQMNKDACIGNWTDEFTSRDSHRSYRGSQQIFLVIHLSP